MQASTAVTAETAASSVASAAPVTSGLAKPVTNGIAAAGSPIETIPSTAQKRSPFLLEGDLEPSHAAVPADPPTQAAERPAAGGRELYQRSGAGTTALVVDDDFRNIFALSALLERGKLEVVAAESGAGSLAVLERRNDIDIVLMHIMMPGMNGYETMQAIRRRPELVDLPTSLSSP